MLFKDSREHSRNWKWHDLSGEGRPHLSWPMSSPLGSRHFDFSHAIKNQFVTMHTLILSHLFLVVFFATQP